jgi:hypothetical protein
MNARTVSISLEVALDGGHIAGSASDGAAPRTFAGWLGLMAALDELIGAPVLPSPSQQEDPDDQPDR